CCRSPSFRGAEAEDFHLGHAVSSGRRNSRAVCSEFVHRTKYHLANSLSHVRSATGGRRRDFQSYAHARFGYIRDKPKEASTFTNNHPPKSTTLVDNNSNLTPWFCGKYSGRL